MDSVRTTGLGKVYHGSKLPVTALQAIDLVVNKGDFLALVGPSGSGKTTLLNMIGALDRPSTGEVYINGDCITGMSDSALAELRLRKIGFVFQEYNLIPVLTALENVEYVMLLQGVDQKERARKVRDILNEVGMGGLESRLPWELSGGQQQRVAFARAMVTEPAIVLADEPTANLDSGTGASLLDLMESLNKTRHTTFILSTHDPMVVERMRRVVQMRDGRLTGASD
jgi:putative ABC transport system ATP-binding protein